MSLKKQIVGYVLDRSSSMQPLASDMIGTFNSQLKTLKDTNEGFDTSLVLTTFSTKVDNPIVYPRLEEVPELTSKGYQPYGWTALYEAVYRTLDQMNAIYGANEPDASFLVVIFSDGEENRSDPAIRALLPKRILDLNKTEAWTFVYIGSDQMDLTKIHQDLHIPVSNIMQAPQTSDGYRGMTISADSAVGGYRRRARSTRGPVASANMFNDDNKIETTVSKS